MDFSEALASAIAKKKMENARPQADAADFLAMAIVVINHHGHDLLLRDDSHAAVGALRGADST